jgi:hypothetical protein
MIINNPSSLELDQDPLSQTHPVVLLNVTSREEEDFNKEGEEENEGENIDLQKVEEEEKEEND